jgi:hypothetical protein
MKCKDTSCCQPAVLEGLNYLPDPVLEEVSLHYKPFSAVYGTETTDADRGALKFSVQKVTEEEQVNLDI